ncbi:MAG: UDP-N-acetylmuramoyl-tripeptide--D-alanyl-D-alanine ligase, partial [Porticoccaceae bacterium]
MAIPDTSFSRLLQKIRPEVEQNIALLGGPWPAFTLFLSFSDGRQRARVIHASSALLDHAWLALQSEGEKQSARHGIDVRWLRVDWVTHAQQLDWKTVRASLKAFKRNYFRNGLALDTEFEVAFLEQELNGNAMLYGGNQWPHAVLNEKNFAIYAGKRFPGLVPDFSDDAVVCIFGTRGVFCELDSAPVQLYASGNNAGRRIVDNLDADTVGGLIARGSRYLASQVQSTGRFHYGWHPCFDRPIGTYNSLRHASTLYSMLEAWEITGDPELAAAIDRGLAYLVGDLIKCIALDDGDMAAFLVDRPGEIKLGGNAVCLLALTKHEELFGTGRYLALLEQLALGIRFMQDPHSGGFVHVLHYPGLEVKEPFRIIYYDGEAAFGLMRLYRLSGDPRWLAMVEKAFDRFIEAEHWKAHDHWLSYCVNELTLCRPDERYYRFGIQNVAGHLGFVRTRITTFPTLLELMMAAKAMIARMLERGEHLHLLKELDLGKFEEALEFRARYLMNGHFWPEYAMYFKNPRRILGGFFIRHHAFRVRIDDVEHYLSGYVAYLKQLTEPSWNTAAMNDNNGSDDGKNNGDALTTGRFMYARLADFQIDVEKLRAHFMQEVRAVAPT